MATWKQIREYARSRYKLQDDEDDNFTLVWGFEDGRSQLVQVNLFEAFERPWIEFLSACCDEDDLDKGKALRKNGKLGCGALVLDQGRYYLRYTHPIDTMDLEELEVPLRAIAIAADQIEAEHAGDDSH